MQFETQAQRDCYERIAIWMEEIARQAPIDGMAMQFFGDVERPIFVITYGSSVVHMAIQPYVWKASQIEDAIISISATVVAGATVNSELLRYLLRHNERLPFGAFALNEVDEIVLKHAFPADACNSIEELALFLGIIALTADEFDDEIVGRWGGARGIELV